jgi:hypothetical protein
MIKIDFESYNLIWHPVYTLSRSSDEVNAVGFELLVISDGGSSHC